MTNIMSKLLDWVNFRLVHNIGVKEVNEHMKKRLQEYIKGGENGTQSEHMPKQKLDS